MGYLVYKEGGRNKLSVVRLYFKEDISYNLRFRLTRERNEATIFPDYEIANKALHDYITRCFRFGCVDKPGTPFGIEDEFEKMD